MKDATQPNHVSLVGLISRLRDGDFVIPDFQREFEWQPWDISALMRSVFLDYFIGSLLLWKGKHETFSALGCKAIYGFMGGAANPVDIVLDGQQRLTAMYYAFMAPDQPAPKRANRYLYFIKVDRFINEEYDDAFTYDWTGRGTNLLQSPDQQYATHHFPLSIIGSDPTNRALYEWMGGYKRHWQAQEKQANQVGDTKAATTAAQHSTNADKFDLWVWDILQKYQVAYIELDRDLPLDKVCDIFTQINSRGIRLDTFDLMNALLRPMQIKLRDMWDEASPRLEFVNTDRMNVYVLQVMSILRQGYCSPKYLYYLLPGQERQIRGPDGALHKEVLVPDTADFKSRWDKAVSAIKGAIDALSHPQQYGAISSQYLPYVSILPGFAALQAEALRLPPQRRLDAQGKVRRWYWASVFLNRYSGSVESTTARDYLDVKAWFDDDLLAPALISEFAERFRGLDLHHQTRRGTSVYNGVFNLLVVNGARDWITGMPPLADDLDDHHIVPKSWERARDLETSIDTILNRTPLTSDTDRNVIRDRLPNEYLPELIASAGEEVVRETLETHLIPRGAFDILLRKPFTPADFEAFVQLRRTAILEAIEDLLIKARLGLPPNLRTLDAQIEFHELGLRNAVCKALNNDPAQLPEHVQQKIKGRIQVAARKNPAIDPKQELALSLQLQYADLRELQDVIASKAHWPQFEALFTTKELLAIRFDQLAELRNSIRHSRSVTDVIRKDGEAALAWFAERLGQP